MCPPEKAPAIPTQDLRDMPRGQLWIELTLPLPWLTLSWLLYSLPWIGAWGLGALSSFMFFLCALRLNHEAIHSNLGLTRAQDFAVMRALSALMLGPNSAIALSHMNHHREAMGPLDFEGRCGHMSLVQVLLYGPRFPVDMVRACWRRGGPKWQARLCWDALAIAAMLGVVAALNLQALWLHVAAMGVAQCLSALFAVWITHRGTAGSGLAARSQRGPLARAAYLMFYHREHHLFPKVPVSRLPDLAARLDATVPGYAQARKPVVPLFERLVQ